MSTHTNGNGSGRKKPRFTVAQAARAFRQARGGEPKVELTDEEGRLIRRDKSGRLVLCDAPESAPPRRRNGKSTEGCAMSTHLNGNAPARRNPRFTVAQATQAFREALGDTKVMLLDDDTHEIRRDDSGWFVLCEKSEAAGNKLGESTRETIR